MPHIVFLHPDLGIGGAEKAVIDAAVALKKKRHTVEFVTSYHDKAHCFPETIDGSLKVTVVGNWLPRNVMGRCIALCAYLRMIYAAVYVLVFCCYDVVFCDQISVCIPVLRLGKGKILFYCHFPDLLLTQRKTILKKIYRYPLDWLEELTTGLAHQVVVNSKFTAEIFHKTFRSLTSLEPVILYPIPNIEALDLPADATLPDTIAKDTCLFLSINRYERKKNLPLTLLALDELRNLVPKSATDCHLIIAGGYDERVPENHEHYLELRMLADRLRLRARVTFLRSVTDTQKRALLRRATALLYTPDREHFGIVPVEAMYSRCPVIAVRSGGPLETIADTVTGFLCDPSPPAFAGAMAKFMQDRYKYLGNCRSIAACRDNYPFIIVITLSKRLGENGRQRVIKRFSYATFSNNLNDIVNGLLNIKLVSLTRQKSE